jgi:hypothetical protein
MFKISFLAILLFTVPIFAGDKEEIQIAFEIAKAKAVAKAAEAAKTKDNRPDIAPTFLNYDLASEMAISKNKFMVVRVGHMDCSKSCKDLRKDAVVAHVESLFDSKTPRFILSYPVNGRLKFWCEWTEVPTAKEVKKEMEKCNKLLAKPISCTDPKCDECIACAVVGACVCAVEAVEESTRKPAIPDYCLTPQRSAYQTEICISGT